MRDPSPRAEFAAGAKAEVPVLFGVLPFGLIYGALALQAGIPPGAALAMSSVVLAGPGPVGRAPVFSGRAARAPIHLTTLLLDSRDKPFNAAPAAHPSPPGLRWERLLASL